MSLGIWGPSWRRQSRVTAFERWKIRRAKLNAPADEQAAYFAGWIAGDIEARHKMTDRLGDRMKLRVMVEGDL